MGGSREAVVQRNNQIAKTAKLTSGILRLDVAAHQMRPAVINPQHTEFFSIKR
jgi:hypothetical protein